MKDTRFMSAVEKEQVLKQWERFLKGGLRWEQFSNSLYHHLIQHCSFIAHYNREGFYSSYFKDGDGVAAFLRQFDRRNAGADGIPPSTEYGTTYWFNDDYRDINIAMIDVATKYIPGLLAQAELSQKEADIAKAKQLLSKHGIKLNT